MALQIHESVGHAIELDRILGWEAAFAGTSWLDPAQLGSMRYGSDLMNITADATLPGALGSFGYDDEGVPAQAVDIVKDGTWVGVLSGRDSAPLVGLTSGGMVRADGAARLPMVRMTNVGLLPGDSSLEEMIAATDDGIYMDTNRSWSIDDKRLNFQFGCEIAWEIKDGQLGQMLRNPTYTGIGPRFWASMDMVGGPDEWVFWGTANCGKGQPIQVGHTGHPSVPGSLHRRPRGGPLMATWDPSRATIDRPSSGFDLCDRVLALVGDRAAALVTCGQGTNALTRFANSRIHQNMAGDDHHVRLRVIVDGGRIAQASTTRLDARRARAARGGHDRRGPPLPPDPEYPGPRRTGARGTTSTTTTPTPPPRRPTPVRRSSPTSSAPGPTSSRRATAPPTPTPTCCAPRPGCGTRAGRRRRRSMPSTAPRPSTGRRPTATAR